MAEYDEYKVKQGIKLILEGIGEDLRRPGLIETPSRVARAYKELCLSYFTKPPEVQKQESKNNQMVVKAGIIVYSLCEHHMVPMKLEVAFGYIPAGTIVGISKIIRLIRWCARRLVVQEDLGEFIIKQFNDKITCKGCMCVIRGEHFCECMRGVEKESVTITSNLSGLFERDESAKAEFLKLVEIYRRK